MRSLDRFLQLWRMRVASRLVPDGSRVLDIGCHRGEFLHLMQDRLGPSVGIDPLAPALYQRPYMTLPMTFQEPLPFGEESFDVIVMLATLEHIRNTRAVARECMRLLRHQGRVVVTVPSTIVDRLVDWLVRFRLADGMSLHQHFGLEPAEVPQCFFEHGLFLSLHRKFQLGLNNLMVFRKGG